MDDWQVGDPADWGDNVGVPDIAYMDYIHLEDEDEHSQWPGYFEKSMELSDRAWKLENQDRFEEALVLIDDALDYLPFYPNHLNRKAIILQDLGRYDEALEFYDKALSLGSDDVISANKAECMLEMLERKQSLGELRRSDLDIINEALMILPDCEDNQDYLKIREDILEM